MGEVAEGPSGRSSGDRDDERVGDAVLVDGEHERAGAGLRGRGADAPVLERTRHGEVDAGVGLAGVHGAFGRDGEVAGGGGGDRVFEVAEDRDCVGVGLGVVIVRADAGELGVGAGRVGGERVRLRVVVVRADAGELGVGAGRMGRECVRLGVVVVRRLPGRAGVGVRVRGVALAGEQCVDLRLDSPLAITFLLGTSPSQLPKMQCPL